MGSAAEVNEPTTGTEKLHQPVKLEEVEEEDEQVVELERKTSSYRNGKRPDSADGSTITTNNSSSSSFSEGITDLRNGEGERIAIEDLEVPESPEKETVVGFHGEHDDGSNGNVYFDGDQGSESAEAEPDAHESQTAERLNAEEKEPVSENGLASEDNKEASREIEEVQDSDLPKEVVDVVVQRTGDVIEEEEEVDVDDVEDYNVEKVLDNQETHDLFCPNCNSCITKRVILKKRKRKMRHVPEDPKRVRGPDPTTAPILRSEDNEPSAVGGDNVTRESFFYKCLSCFSIFIPTGVDSKPVAPIENVERLNTQPKSQEEEATVHSNWFDSLFGPKKKGPPGQQGGAMPTIPEASLPRDSPGVLGEKPTGSYANVPTKAPALVQDGKVTPIQDVSEISVSEDNKPVDTPLIQVANSNETSKGVNSGATVEIGQQFQVPFVDEEQTQQKIDRNDASAAEENHSSDKGRLSPIQPARDMNISNIVTSGPDGVRVETIFHTEGVSHLFEGTDPRKPDLGLAKVTGVVDSGGGGPIRGIDIPSSLPLSSLEEGTLTEPLVRPVVTGPVVEGRKVEILKSIVYGGLIEAITSLGVISSAAGSGATTLNILVLGLANLFGGLILIIHNLQELREEEPIITTTTTTEDNQTNVQEEGRYKRLLGRRENFTLHVTVAIISFIIMGLLPPIVYYFSFSKTHNRDYKVASVFGASLLCIVLLAIAKAHVRSPRGSHLKSVLKYAMIAVSVSGISYVVGNFVDQLLEKYGWADGTETPTGEMMLALMGRKGGSFGYSSSY